MYTFDIILLTRKSFLRDSLCAVIKTDVYFTVYE